MKLKRGFKLYPDDKTSLFKGIQRQRLSIFLTCRQGAVFVEIEYLVFLIFVGASFVSQL